MVPGHDEHEGHEPPGEALKSVDDIRKFSPQERIKRLKELEDARKKEIEEAEKLIKETVLELADAEERRIIPIPEARATDLSSLDTAEEKQLVATHHFLAAGEQHEPQPQARQQPKNLEELAEEAKKPEQPSQTQKPAYSIGTEQQRSAFGEYLSKSQQTVTGGGPVPGSGDLEKITEIYKDKPVTGAESEDAQKKYFGTHQQVTGGEYTRKKEQEDKKQQSEVYQRKGGGPA